MPAFTLGHGQGGQQHGGEDGDDGDDDKQLDEGEPSHQTIAKAEMPLHRLESSLLLRRASSIDHYQCIKRKD